MNTGYGQRSWNAAGRSRGLGGAALARDEIRRLEGPGAERPRDRAATLRLRQLASEFERAQTGAVAALSLVLDLKDLETGQYARQLSGWAVRVGEQLGLDERELADLEVASLLYDVGKIGVPDQVLLKPDRLTDEEYALVRKHPEYGWGILRAIPGFESAALLVLHHHERWDGSGYPAGLAGEQIPLGSRILAVVDTIEAMLSDRPYRPRFAPREVIGRLRPRAGSQFDPRVVEKFVRLAGWSLSDLGPTAPSGEPSPAGLSIHGPELAGQHLATI